MSFRVHAISEASQAKPLLKSKIIYASVCGAYCMSVCCPLEYTAFGQYIAKIAWTGRVGQKEGSESASALVCTWKQLSVHYLMCVSMYVCLCLCVELLCGTLSVYFDICMDVCVGAPDEQPRPPLPPLGSLISCLNMPQWSSPKDHDRCQTLQAPSALATSQGTKMPVPGPHWVAPAGLPRSSVFSSISQLIGWGGEGWGEEQ